MKKTIVVLSALALVTGCAVKPPKAHHYISNNEPIIVKENSSSALVSLYESNAVGVRDLTQAEFSKNEKDVERLATVSAQRDGFNRAAYEAGGIGLGLAAGLSLNTVLGYGAVTSIFSDDRPDNYVFAWDFDSGIKLFSPSGVDVESLEASIKKSMDDALILFEELLPIGGEFKTITNPKGTMTKAFGRKDISMIELEYFTHVFHSNEKIPGGSPALAMISSHRCTNGDAQCSVSVELRGRKSEKLPMAITVAQLIATNLKEDQFVYFPPDKSLYRLPMIIRGGTGEIEYLVEK